ncbi:MAG TPA: tetrahydromethanopterin S-methyltransferase subunit B [Methanothermococcus okinawensis]|uniref:Tetrahydromethanopterin S-methyltransferase subunit B n=1 Tax=Methanothermococcus okinawensis TaxID=155863 RepID=A0A832ZHT7_9EURY|nr:tetrahydromethanopterin S-methyltransferase subunit B [Methanothermococcus okinawensis]HIP90782.1 tetrahydromethanopterin S-methyltransferase subunit B [Methanothermococcus okinawensis]
MDIVKICPELGIVMDVDSGLIAEMREDIVMVDLKPVKEEIEKLENLAKAFENSLDPRNPPLKSYPGREGVYSIGGIFTGVFFGFWITMGIALLIILLLVALYPNLLY